MSKYLPPTSWREIFLPLLRSLFNFSDLKGGGIGGKVDKPAVAVHLTLGKSMVRPRAEGAVNDIKVISRQSSARLSTRCPRLVQGLLAISSAS